MQARRLYKSISTPIVLGSIAVSLTIFLLVVYRIGYHVPIPGVDQEQMAKALEKEAVGSAFSRHASYVSLFSGGNLSQSTIFGLGIMPYISASIIIQLLTTVSPQLEALKKEGEAGRKTLNQYTRYLTVILAAFQSYGIAVGLEGAGNVVSDPGLFFRLSTAITLTGGTMFLMWLGEQITARGIGNGISLIIFAGIVAQLPHAVVGTLELGRQGALSTTLIILLLVMAVVVIAIIVFMERAQRRLLVQYPKRQGTFQGDASHLPLKLNSAGVIPPIFASSIILFPATLASWFGANEHMVWLKDVAGALSPGNALYILMYGGAIVFFCFFYTALVFSPKETADNLKKSGAFLPGIRPGEQTAKYVEKIMLRLTMVGAVYITLVCLLPEFLVVKWNVPFYFGGTSLLILVVVTMDFMAQVQAYVMSHQYESLLKKANFKGGVFPTR